MIEPNYNLNLKMTKNNFVNFNIPNQDNIKNQSMEIQINTEYNKKINPNKSINKKVNIFI